MQKRLIPILLAAALFISGVISVVSIHRMQGNARVINYAGVVRGATQRLVKQELNGRPNDTLIARLDGILSELAEGEGENDLIRLEDETFQALVAQMQTQWAELKNEIQLVRAGSDGSLLYKDSESYFTLADRTVNAAESYSERQVTSAEWALVLLSAVFLFIALFMAWHGAAQAKREKKLKEAEARSRVETEQLTRMSEDLRASMNELSELIYVSDTENHELLFMNEAGRQSFNISKLEGQKCYRILQGLESPCDFCSNSFLKVGENYTWEITNAITKRHYLLKDRLVQWDGRPAKMEIAFDITEAEAEKQSLKTTLDTEQMVMECVRTLYQEHDLHESFPSVLEQLGLFLSAGQAYLAMVENDHLYNDFMWCKESGSFSHDFLQRFPKSVLSRWRSAFQQQGYVMIEDIESLRERAPEEYALLQSQGTHCLVAVPLEQGGELQGILGVHNSPPERIRSIVPLLQTLCYFLMLTYLRTESEQQLSQLSYFDTLTSFYNRNRYIKDTTSLEDYSGPLGIVYLDVNGLKDINDRLGHAYGDKALVECARQMREIFEGADYYRIGGDEFVIICPGIDQIQFESKAASLRRCFESNELCHAAIGAQWDRRAQDLQQVIAQADAQMYEDKKEFYRRNPISNRYRHLNDEMLPLSDPEVLKEELRKEHFVVYLQPKVSTSDRSAVGAEALIRYQSRTGSLILPGNFLSMLEQGQTVSQVDFYVFEYACSRLKEWSRQGKQTFTISVNFSGCTLSQPDFIERLTALCEKHGVEKKCLEIELTEAAREIDGVDFKSLIHNLRQAGFIVSLDDFGTESTNLALLSSVELDVLKLDKSLVDDVAHNPKASAVIESIVDICTKMQIDVVAEGIETEEQLEALRACGVELVQGYLFSKPIPIEEYEKKYLS